MHSVVYTLALLAAFAPTDCPCKGRPALKAAATTGGFIKCRSYIFATPIPAPPCDPINGTFQVPGDPINYDVIIWPCNGLIFFTNGNPAFGAGVTFTLIYDDPNGNWVTEEGQWSPDSTLCTTKLTIETPPGT